MDKRRAFFKALQALGRVAGGAVEPPECAYERSFNPPSANY